MANNTNIYVVNPFQADIFPGDSAGQKLFLAATKPADDDKRLSISTDNDAAEAGKAALIQASSNFGWPRITTIPTRCATGTPLDYVDLLKNPEKLSVNNG